MRTWRYIALFLFPAVAFAQQQAYVSPAGTKFLLYTPPAYANSTESFPLLVSLHGKGEWGTDITKLTSGNSTGMPSRLIYLNQWPASYNFIVLTPQYNPPNINETNPIWPPSHIDEVVRYVVANWRVKTYRMYVTGLSLGANATWNYTAAYPQKVAAIVPISGRADLTKACLLKDIPAWVFHGDSDPTATMYYSKDMVKAIDNCQPPGSFNRKFNILYTRLHEGWNEIYNGSGGYKIFEWMMKFHKNSAVNTTPYVNAGPDINIKLSASPVNIIADAFDSKGTLTSLQWRQISGTSLTLGNTDRETLQVSNLKAGTFEFELSATDNSGATVSDRMILRVYSTTTLPVVNTLTLMNGETNSDVLTLTQGAVIDKALTGLREINVRANATSNSQSVRFTVNTNRNTRTVNAPGPFLIRSQVSGKPEWEIMPGEYVICATPFTGSNGTGTRGISQCVTIKVIEGVAPAGCEGAGSVFREVWPGVPGQYVSNIPLTTAPAVQSELFKLEAPTGETGVGDNYGARIRGYICPPQSGKYYFWISSDNFSELWLSTDSNPGNKAKIAMVSGYTGPREWTKYGSQRSSLITLSASTKYYFEVLHKESTLADHVAVGWQLPSGVLERPIPGIRIIPFAESSAENLDDVFMEEAVGIYPNPLSRYEKDFNISGAASSLTRPVQIRVISATGQIIIDREVTEAHEANRIPVQLDNALPAGIYMIAISTPRGQFLKKLLVR